MILLISEKTTRLMAFAADVFVKIALRAALDNLIYGW
jgi:hypothetical protein